MYKKGGESVLLLDNGQKIPCICVTNRKLCQGNFFQRIERIGEEGKADALILREKDIKEEEYLHLAEGVLAVCERWGMKCILHTYYRAAEVLGCRKIHIPLGILSSLDRECLQNFDEIGTSVHSVEEAVLARRLGVDHIIAGHVFETDCKKGMVGRGTEFVKKICEETDIPVYGIGGITKDNADVVMKAGAEGVCIMSGFMKAPHGALSGN